MNIVKIVVIVNVVFTLLLGMIFYDLKRKLNNLNESIASMNAKIFDTQKSLNKKTEEFDDLIKKHDEQISILDESISPADKRWAKVKKVRKSVTDIIKQNGYTKVPDINGLTSYASAVVDYSEQYDVPVPLILAITTQESAFNVYAVSKAGASGLMQLLAPTAKECANDINKPFFNVFKIRDNVQLGTWYLWRMLDVFNGDVGLAIRGYNAGPTYVKKVLSGDINEYPKETINYHELVLKWKTYYENSGL